MTEYFFKESILFHIKNVIVLAIAEYQNPTEEEYKLIKDIVNSSFHWQNIFFDNASLRFNIKKDLLKLLNLKVSVDSPIKDLMPIHFENQKDLLRPS